MRASALVTRSLIVSTRFWSRAEMILGHIATESAASPRRSRHLLQALRQQAREEYARPTKHAAQNHLPRFLP
jgi:hypothetical protein